MVHGLFGFYKTEQMKKIEHGGNNINNAYDKGADILTNKSDNSKYFIFRGRYVLINMN